MLTREGGVAFFVYVCGVILSAQGTSRSVMVNELGGLTIVREFKS